MIKENFNYIDYSNKKSFIHKKTGTISLREYPEDLQFYVSFDGTTDANYFSGIKQATKEDEAKVSTKNNGVFGQHLHLEGTSLAYDRSNFTNVRSEGSVSFRLKTDFNNAPGYQKFKRTEDPIITSLPFIDKDIYKFGGGSLNLVGDEEKRISYSYENLTSLAQEGTIDFFFRPNYDGTPEKNISLLDIYNGTDNNNRITITHEDDEMLHFRIYNQTGSLASEVSFEWNAEKGKFVNISFNFDLNNGNTKVFINGNQYGATDTSTSTRNALSSGELRIGASEDYITNFYIDDFVIFNKKKRNSSYSIRNNAQSDSDEDIIVLARFNTTRNLNIGEVKEPTEVIPTTDEYGFRLYIDTELYSDDDIFIELNPDDDLTEVFNKISLALDDASVYISQEDNGQIKIEASQNGALIEIESPSEGRDLLSILDGVEEPRLPNGPSSDTKILDFYNGSNNFNRITIVHTKESHILIKMWDKNGNKKVDRDTGEWRNWSSNWYAFELNWNKSFGQLFIDGNLIDIFTTNIERNGDVHLYLKSHSNDHYRFDEFIVYNTYQNNTEHTVPDSPLTPYDTENPYIDIYFGDGFKEEQVSGLSFSTSQNVHFTIKIGNTWYYYYNGSWRNADGSYSRTNSPRTFADNFAELYFNEDADIIIRAYFTSDGLNEEWIEYISIELDDTIDSPAIITGTVDLRNDVDLSEDSHVTITTSREKKEVDLTSEIEGKKAYIVGDEDLSSGRDWSSESISFEFNGEIIELNENTESLDEIVNLINSQMPSGFEALKDDVYLAFQSNEKGSSIEIELNDINNSLAELGFDEGIYTGEDPDYENVSLQDIKNAINAANIDGLAPASDNGKGYLVLMSSDKGEDAFISISEGDTTDALAIVWGEAASDSGESAQGPFFDYSIITDWIRAQLGAPIVPVELTDEQIENAVAEAVYWYNYYRNSKENMIKVKLEGNEKEGFKIPEEVGGEQNILEIILRPRFPFAYYTGGDVDSIMSNVYMQWMFQRGRHAGFNDFLGDYYITLSTEKDYNIILGTEVRWRFYNGRIFLNPRPRDMDAIIVFKSALSMEEINTNQIIREYALGISKRTLGTIRSTFGGQIPGGTEQIQLNGDSLKTEGKEEIDAAFAKMQSLMEPFGFDFG